MDRRAFLAVWDSRVLSEKESKRENINLSLAPLEVTLDRKKALHLLRRLYFSVTTELLNQIVGKTATEAVEMLLGDGLDYLPANSGRLPDGNLSLNWLDKIIESPLRVTQEIKGILEATHNSRYVELLNWWLELMRIDDLSSNPAREKLTHFWHGHWCIDFNYDGDDLIPPPLLYRNLQRIRKFRLGDFKKFVQEMTLDGAYLLFQSLNESTKGKPNENYMRELMELFTMGIGNYSEGDIREGARALTGWRVTAHLGDRKVFDNFDTYFSGPDHDITSKTLIGETILARTDADNNIDKVKVEEVFGVIDILFKRRPDPIAHFICDKIYRYFVYSNPSAVDENIIKNLAEVFKSSNFNLKPVFVTLFSSQAFYDDANIGIQIKTPADLIVGLGKLLNVKYASTNQAMIDMEQKLYNPPDVSGWKGYHAWISTKTYPMRIIHSNALINGAKNSELIAFAKKIPNADNAKTFLDGVLELTLPVVISTIRKDRLLSVMLTASGLTEATWTGQVSSGSDAVANGLKALLLEIVRVPDFQLA